MDFEDQVKKIESETRSAYKACREHMKDLGWNEETIDVAMSHLNSLMLVLYINQFPMKHEKFPEVLRATANILETMIQNAKKDT